MNEYSENTNKEIENMRNDQIDVTKVKNTITELENTIEGFDSRLSEAEERVNKLKQGSETHPIKAVNKQRVKKIKMA